VSWLLNAKIHLLGADILWREIIGNLFGLVSAVLGMRRRVTAWPVGMAGNVLLFTVFLGGVFATPQDKNLYGQAGRQVFFFAASLYGWALWQRNRRERAARAGGAADAGAVRPRWATNPERLALLVAAAVGVVVGDLILRHLASFGPLSDAWIFTGSLLATYGMARGYVEFWLIWIAVDAVGVPLLLRAHYYPSALLYVVYGGFCVWGFAAWWRLQRRLAGPTPASPEMEAVG